MCFIRSHKDNKQARLFADEIAADEEYSSRTASQCDRVPSLEDINVAPDGT